MSPIIRSGTMTLANTQVVTGNTSRTRPENRVIYPALDGFRALAFLMVFSAHYLLLPWGYTGVNFFFVLSGFLITGILFDARDDPHRARNFYVRRSLRIFPLYYGVFAAILLTWPIAHWRLSPAWFAWPLYVGNFLRFRSLTANAVGTDLQLAADAQLFSPRLPGVVLFLGHFWSLCVEEQFYLLWPWVVFWTRSRRALLWICAAVVVLGPLARVLAQHTAPPWMISAELLYRVTPFQLDSLLLGGLVGLLWRGEHRDRLILCARFVAAAAALLTIIYLARTISSFSHDARLHYMYPEWRFTWGLSFANVFAAAIILCILRPGGFLFHLFNFSLLRWIGRISYGAYIVHDLLHSCYSLIYVRSIRSLMYLNSHFSFLLTYKSQLIPFFSLAATLALSWLSFRFLESPFLNLKERWTLRA